MRRGSSLWYLSADVEKWSNMKAMKVVPRAKAAKAMKAMKAMKAVKAKKKPAAVKAMESPVEFAEPDPVAEMWQTRERARRFKEKQDAIRARLQEPAVSDTSEEQEKQVDDTVGASRMRQEVEQIVQSMNRW